MASAAKVVVISRCMQNHIAITYEVPAHKITIIRNWADPAQILPGLKNNRFRHANGLTGFVLLYGGNFSHYVNFSQILGAAKLLMHREDITFVLIGDGVRKEWIVKEINEEQLKNVRILPAVSRNSMNDILAASDACLISLDSKMLGLGSPGKLYSIMASGRPIIAIVPELSEVAMILKEENCGVIVVEGDARGLANEITRLHQNADLLDQMGKKSRLALEARFTIEHVGLEFYALFNEVKAF